MDTNTPRGRRPRDNRGREESSAATTQGIPDHLLTCLLRNLYADQEATIRTGLGTMDLFHIGKGV